jgi:hypothetical protein
MKMTDDPSSLSDEQLYGTWYCSRVKWLQITTFPDEMRELLEVMQVCEREMERRYATIDRFSEAIKEQRRKGNE